MLRQAQQDMLALICVSNRCPSEPVEDNLFNLISLSQ